MRWLARLHDGLTVATFWVATAAVAYLTLVTAWEVFGRYALGAPSDWAPDTAAVAFAMITFLAAPMVTQRADHARMGFVVEKAPPPIRIWMMRIVFFVGFSITALVAWFGALETIRQVERGVTMIAVTPIPKWLVTGVIVYALASMALHFLRHLIATFRRTDSESETAG